MRIALPAASSSLAILAVLAVLFLGAGCYDPDLSGEGFFRCSDGVCPSGFTCNAQQICVRDGDVIPQGGKCSASDPVGVIPEGHIVVGKVGVALDPATNTLVVAYPAFDALIDVPAPGEFRSVFVTSRGLADPGAGWEPPQEFAPLVGNATPETAVDALEGNVGVLFSDPDAAIDGLTALGFVERQAGEPEPGDFIDLPSELAVGPFTGQHLAIRWIDGDRVAIVGQAESNVSGIGGTLRGRLFTMDVANFAVLAGPVPVTIPASEGERLETGFFNRLSLSRGSGSVEASLAFLGITQAAANESVTQAYVASWNLGTALPTPPEAVGPQSLNTLPGDLGGIGLVHANGPKLAIAARPEASDESLFVTHDNPLTALPVQIGEAVVAEARGPSIAVQGARTAVSFLGPDEAVHVTARTSRDSPWLPEVVLDDTGGTRRAVQAELIASEVKDGGVALQLVYLVESEGGGTLLHREVVCTF